MTDQLFKSVNKPQPDNIILNEINFLSLYVGNKEVIRIFPTSTGFGVKIPDDINMDEAAAQFIYALRDQIKNLKSLESIKGIT